MTSKTDNRRTPGFTLIELLVVMGIVALLIGILLPAVSKIIREAKRTAVAGQLQAISVGIQAYHDDFGIYPPVPTYDSGPNAGLPIPNTAFAALGQCLLGVGGFLPGPLDGAYDSTKIYGAGSHVGASGSAYLAFKDPDGVAPPDATAWVQFNGCDGLDGFGFKMRRLPGGDDKMYTADDKVFGKTYGPYLSDKFPTRGFALTDSAGNAILYFPNYGKKLTATQPYVDALTGAAYVNCIFNTNDSALLPKAAMQSLMGDSNNNGKIDSGETAATTAPYLLWAPGPDGIYGYNSSNKSDDVTNFTLSNN